MERCLLIVAAGKSSRFGGFPKAFENTIEKAQQTFSKIYLAVNEETYHAYKGILHGCTMFDIITGNGDAHSLLKCLLYLKQQEPEMKTVTACWGDACFVNGTPFWELMEGSKRIPEQAPITVACSWDKTPYAWFETENGSIKKSYFAASSSSPEQGLHDQSLFFINVDLVVHYLTQYKALLNVPDEYIPDGKNEMKLLYSFDFLYESKEFEPAQITMVQGGNVLSFNTKEELERIKKYMRIDED